MTESTAPATDVAEQLLAARIDVLLRERETQGLPPDATALAVVLADELRAALTAALNSLFDLGTADVQTLEQQRRTLIARVALIDDRIAQLRGQGPSPGDVVH